MKKNNGTEHSSASPDHYACSNLTNSESILHAFLQIKERQQTLRQEDDRVLAILELFIDSLLYF